MAWMKWMVRGVLVAGGWIIAAGCGDDAEPTTEGEVAGTTTEGEVAETTTEGEVAETTLEGDHADTMLEGEFACGSDRCDAETEYCEYPAESCEQGSGGLDGVPACVPFPDGCEPGCECLSTGPCTVRDGGVHLGSGQTCG
jgi:hypothetical protein